jgi:hypothetical protein
VQTLRCDNIDALDANAYWCSAALLIERPHQQRADVAIMGGIVKELARFVLGSTLALAACAEPIPVSVTELGTNLTPGYGFTAVDVNDNGQSSATMVSRQVADKVVRWSTTSRSTTSSTTQA